MTTKRECDHLRGKLCKYLADRLLTKITYCPSRSRPPARSLRLCPLNDSAPERNSNETLGGFYLDRKPKICARVCIDETDSDLVKVGDTCQ
ncbi:hypothetical protein EVAR_60991_1 [Eumeta japonica]|uniref:Uncharacterized protein n=1 Tax=Eumeta variegata TaxID=151549 RepID=A0A4C1ZLD8_EUMVA|nr:hypothetical protein EVAR_60991_1 [Eumeta japonica]